MEENNRENQAEYSFLSNAEMNMTDVKDMPFQKQYKEEPELKDSGLILFMSEIAIFYGMIYFMSIFFGK